MTRRCVIGLLHLQGANVTHRKSSERTLFYSLWVVLLLAFGIWKFWPGERYAGDANVDILLNQELSPWFSHAIPKGFRRGRYVVELKLTPEYRKSLQGLRRKIQLSYDMTAGEGLTHTGIIDCLLRPQKPTTKIQIPNPFSENAQRIELSFAGRN